VVLGADNRELALTRTNGCSMSSFARRSPTPTGSSSIDNPELLTLLGKNDDNLTIRYAKEADKLMATIGFADSRYRSFPYQELSPFLAEIDDQAKLAGPGGRRRAHAVPARGAPALRESRPLPDAWSTPSRCPAPTISSGELLRFQQALPEGVAAIRAKEAGQPHNEDDAQTMIDLGKRYVSARPGDQCPGDPARRRRARSERLDDRPGQAILEAFNRGAVAPGALAYAGLGYAWRTQSPTQFNKLIEPVRRRTRRALRIPAQEGPRGSAVQRRSRPSTPASLLYAAAFLLGHRAPGSNGPSPSDGPPST
jgi:hypothetical protein